MALGNVRYESITVNGNIDIAYPGGIGTIDIRSADYDSVIRFITASKGGDVGKPVSIAVTATNT